MGVSGKIFNSNILTEIRPNIKQISSDYNTAKPKFLSWIKNQRLTESLIFLGTIGIDEDLASFTIKHFNSFIRGYES